MVAAGQESLAQVSIEPSEDARLLQLAAEALVADEVDRVAWLLAACPPLETWPPALVVARWVVEARLAGRLRRASPSAPVEALRRLQASVAPGPGRERVVEALLELAAQARRDGELEAGRRWLAEARAWSEEGRENPYILEEAAEQQASAGQLGAAVAGLVEAAERWGARGAGRCRGRAELRIVELVEAGAPSAWSAAVWLARAQVSFGETATFRDRSRLRRGFRRHGRRQRDSVLDGEAVRRLDAIDEEATALSALVRTLVELRGAGRAVPDTAEQATAGAAAVRGHASELVEQLAATAVELGQLHALLDAVAELSSSPAPGVLWSRACALALEVLDADRALLVRWRRPGEGEVVAQQGAPAPAGLVDEALAVGLSGEVSVAPAGVLRRDLALLGPSMDVEVRLPTERWVLHVDRRVRGGAFDGAHQRLAVLFARYLGHVAGWVLSQEGNQRALAEVQAAFEAVRDGVLSVDERGVVRAANASACRMLGQATLVGHRLDDLAELAPLGALLSPPRRLDGATVRLPSGSLVVSARPLATERGGVVATLLEMDRAQRLAASVVGARPRYRLDDVIGRSAALHEVLRVARQAAALDVNVLITGESGTGKEVFAQIIHTGGPRRDRPYVGINCAALPGGLLESELFGYERGSFTGGRAEGNLGKLELAGEGTLLLDEIGDMPLDMQAKLLRVLQERVVVRLGSAAERPMRARIVATTHRDLEQAVRLGSFRLDLLYRLRVLHLHLPPLRERPEDIPDLALAFVRRSAEALGRPPPVLAPAVLDELAAHRWPGNVRELANVIEREVGLLPRESSSLDRLQVPLLPAEPRASAPIPSVPPPSLSPPSIARQRAARAAMATSPEPDDEQIEPMAVVERRVYLRALALSGGHVGQAAKALGVSRSRFYELLKQWGVGGEERSPESLRKVALGEGSRAKDD